MGKSPASRQSSYSSARDARLGTRPDSAIAQRMQRAGELFGDEQSAYRSSLGTKAATRDYARS